MLQNELYLLALCEAGPVAETAIEQVIDSRFRGVLPDHLLPCAATDEPLNVPLLEERQSWKDLIKQRMPKKPPLLARLHGGDHVAVSGVLRKDLFHLTAEVHPGCCQIPPASLLIRNRIIFRH